MHKKMSKVMLLTAIFLLFLFSRPSLSFAQTSLELEILPERVLLLLRKEVPGQYKLQFTTNPMKVIIDSSLPLTGLPALQKADDVALKQLRYEEQENGSARLVLDFNYQLPPPRWQEAEGFLQVEVDKEFVNTTERLVTTGVLYGHQRRAGEFGPNVVNYLEIRTRFTGVQVKLALAQGRILGSENVSEIAGRFQAIAAVNGAFFGGDGRPLGVFMIDSQLVSEPYAQRTALGLGPNLAVMDGLSLEAWVNLPHGRQGAITGINRPRGEDDLIVYTPYYGETTRTNGFGRELTVMGDLVVAEGQGGSKIPAEGFVLSGHGLNAKLLETITVGDAIGLHTQLTPDWASLGVQQIIGGGPRLIKDGEILITGEEEKFQRDVLVGRAPRTALGIKADGNLLLVTVNGRQPNISVGMTLQELAALLQELGAVQAMNLDGGGSTTMVIRDLVLNLPSTGEERPVSNAILIIVPEGRR